MRRESSRSRSDQIKYPKSPPKVRLPCQRKSRQQIHLSKRFRPGSNLLPRGCTRTKTGCTLPLSDSACLSLSCTNLVRSMDGGFDALPLAGDPFLHRLPQSSISPALLISEKIFLSNDLRTAGRSGETWVNPKREVHICCVQTGHSDLPCRSQKKPVKPSDSPARNSVPICRFIRQNKPKLSPIKCS